MIYCVVPEALSTASAAKGLAAVGLKTIYADARFWKLAPLSATCIGSAWALQGLWAAPWLTDVEGIDRPALVRHLFIMAVALGAAAVLLGTAADRLARRGIGPEGLMAILAATLIAAQLTLILPLPIPSYLGWSVVAAAGAGTVVSYAIVAEYFPKELAGRANGALNVFHLGGAFVLQYSTGLIVQQWAAESGQYPATAYRAAFAVNVALQILALIWFELPRLQRFWLAFWSISLHTAFDPRCGTLQTHSPVAPASCPSLGPSDGTRSYPSAQLAACSAGTDRSLGAAWPRPCSLGRPGECHTLCRRRSSAGQGAP